MNLLRRIDWISIILGLATMAAVMIVFSVVEDDTITEIEEAVFDQYQRLSPRPYQQPDPDRPGELLPPPPVIVVDIDEESLAELGQWPWPRYFLSEMVWRLSEAGAATVAFDVLFSEPDRTSPPQQARGYARFGELYGAAVEAFNALNQSTPIDHDLIFADAIRRNPVVLSTIGTNDPTDGRLPPQPKGIPISGEPVTLADVLDHFEGAIVNLEDLSASAKAVGAISLAEDTSTMVRTVPLVVALGNERWPFPALSIEALRVAQNAQSHVIKTSIGSGEGDFSDTPVMTSMQTGGVVLPLTERGHLRVRFSYGEVQRTVSAMDILRPDGIPPDLAERLAGKIIFVGSSAAGLFDIRQTPLHDIIAGVHIHAEIVEQIIQQDFLSRPDLAFAFERIVLVLCGLLVILLLGFNMPLFGFFALIGSMVLICGGSWLAFSQEKLLLSPVAPALGVLLPHFLVSGYKFFRSEAGRKEVTRQFEHFVSPDVIEDILDNPDLHLTPGGAERTLSILFLDVRRFSTITESMKPQEVISFINDLLTPLTDAILEHEGTIDKYMGDAVMAFWNAPRETPQHEIKAVRAMMAFDAILEQLNPEFQARGIPLIEIGTGINTGVCSVGNMGSLKRLAYSCVGDSVNLAARLEGQTKAYGVKNLIGSATAAGLGTEFAIAPLDAVAVKGRSQPETVYTVAGGTAVLGSTAWENLDHRLETARAHYLKQEWDLAETAYRQAADIGTVGAFHPRLLADIMIERINEYRADPPPPDWDGVFVATSK